MCSYCERSGYDVAGCDKNPKRNIPSRICSLCGHSDVTCWFENRGHRKESQCEINRFDFSQDVKQGRSAHFGLVAEAPSEVVVTRRRLPDAEPVQKKARRANSMQMPRILNPKICSPAEIQIAKISKSKLRPSSCKTKAAKNAAGRLF